MDRESILLKIQGLLDSAFGQNQASLEFLDNDVIRLLVISDFFKDISVSKRVGLVSESLLDLSTTELVEYDLIINALTVNEMKNKSSETGVDLSKNSHDDGFAAHP